MVVLHRGTKIHVEENSIQTFKIYLPKCLSFVFMRKKTRKTLILKAAVSGRIFKQALIRLGSGNKVSDVGEG